MIREPSAVRPDWRERVEAVGLVYPTTPQPDGTELPYWYEAAAYVLTEAEVAELEAVTERLHGMCVEAAAFLASGALGDLGLPPDALEAVRASIAEAPPSLYGRFDLRHDGAGPAKLLEYNADTPTGLVEAAVAQWHWLQDLHPDRDQWNSLHDRLVAAWQRVARRTGRGTVHLAHSGQEESGEEWMTVAYLRDTAMLAGWLTYGLEVEQLGWDPTARRFVGLSDEPVEVCFKLYPWEDMLREPFGRRAVLSDVVWIEPLWKVVLSNKALLAALWHLYPGHENLLPAHLHEPGSLTEWVAKPLHGREGGGIRARAAGVSIDQPGRWGAEGYCYQQWAPLPDFDGNRAVVGSWVVDGVAAGCGIRESDSWITDERARFVPHWIDAPAPGTAQVRSWLEEDR
ncbi:glutathionylspermidine synthase family protein [Quadrisphaera sp. DSM 44207]|uniref:glutathionylspermidine synthase family protein n=1 Tax=Quadrisphaera sp. DSM 44207 TaxID=1881057 RepID=UPI00088FA032|nr:glutathionylspermidine synthase family protein [Quadrisphaera sp. DSM 44207]SDQ42570.1 Glutathionylspermidine synthase [Quadrisphaera sp. DSM 44207]